MPDTEENLERKTSQHDIHICLDPSDSESSTTSTQLKTKHAACVSKVLGTTEKVIKFDELRHQLKTEKKLTESNRYP